MKFSVGYKTMATSYVEVEAANEEEALDKAEAQFEWPHLCAQCNGWGATRSVNSGIEIGEWEPIEGPDGCFEIDS